MFADPLDLDLGREFRLRDRLARPEPLLAVELRPPRRNLSGVKAMEAWIDVYHALDKLTQADTAIFLTDSAVGTSEEENLAHLVNNLGRKAVRERIVPFLTLKHPLDYCLRYAVRTRRERFPGLVVLGGDPHDGIPRCLPHAFELRELLRQRDRGLLLGGWINPYRGAERQVELLLQHRDGLDFALTQILSHHDPAPVEALRREVERQGLNLPLFAGVFFFRSPRRETLEKLAHFIPVPVDPLVAEFASGAEARQVAARTLTVLRQLGFSRFYISNFPTARAAMELSRLARLAGFPDPLAASALPPASGR